MRKLLPFFSFLPVVYALPTNPEVISGLIEQNGSEIVCSDRSVLKWEQFHILREENLRFTLPSLNSSVLNQVQTTAQIDGSLFSNGQVYFSAPNGVVISKDAVIDVGALIISTNPIDKDAFIRGEDFFFSNEGLIQEANISVEGALLSRSPDGKLYINAPGGQIHISGKMEGESIDIRAKTIGISPQTEIASTGNLALIAEKEQNLAGSLSGQTVQIEITASQAPATHLLGKIRGVDLVQIKLPNLINQGAISATKVLIETTSSYVDVAKSSVIAPAKISFSGNAESSFFSSGTLSSPNGGKIEIDAETIRLAGAKISADGEHFGGEIFIGNREFTKSIFVTGSTHICAKGETGGKVRLLSGVDIEQYGSISVDGLLKGGEIEISGINVSLNRDNRLSANFGGQIYLDPKNITIAATPTGVCPQYDFLDPTPSLGTGFGTAIAALSNGNIVIAKPNYNPGGAANTGAVYLYNGLTAELISTVTGSSANDLVGHDGIATLAGNSNYVIRSGNWSSGGVSAGGAATWADGALGISGTVNPGNSLIGSSASDNVSSSSLTSLANGNYVVGSTNWDVPGSAANVGAVTWGNGTTGVTGTVSVLNSLIGSSTSDQISSSGLVTLHNGSYVVRSPLWSDPGGISGVGAATWGSGTTGVTGTVSFLNSLIGSSASDGISSGTVTALENSNYVVASPNWDIPLGPANAGAATWGSGTTGVTGTVSALNSLIGSNTSDQISGSGITALTNNNYVVRSRNWSIPGGPVNAGAATWGNGTTGITGTVSILNSLIGANTNDLVAQTDVAALTNGNYVVGSSSWNIPGGAPTAGAATWGNGATGITGTVSISNSLIGSTASDNISSQLITPLANGNYVVGSRNWDILGGASNVGAATWGNGSTGVTGTVSISNSLIGSTASDNISFAQPTALTNGNYVVSSQNWDIPGGATNVGAATWGNGTTGITGTVSISNSLIGTDTNNSVANIRAVALENGNYVVRSSLWDTPAGAMNVGAATWGNGTTGTTGTVSISNSLVGSTPNDTVNTNGVFSSPDGSFFIILSRNWDQGATADVGAITWGNGTTGADVNGNFGTVSAQNSLIGGSSSPRFGTVTLDSFNETFIGSFTGDTSGGSNGRVRAGIYNPNQMTFERAQGQDMTVLPAFLTTTLNAGTDVEIQANNDITISSPITVNNGSGNGGALSLTAGRSVAISANITTDSGSLTVTANDPSAVSAERDAGDAGITVGAGVTINTAAGNLTMQILGSTNSGDIDLGIGSTLTTTTGDILLIAGTDLTASGAASILSTSAGDITLVVDNAFPTSPSIGPGLFNIPSVTISSDGLVRLYAGELGISTFPAQINGTTYDPGSEVNEQGPIYYPSGSGGSPFIVFYKEQAGPPPPPPSPSPTPTPTPSGSPTEEEKNRAKFKYFSATNEAFSRWITYSYGGIEGFRFYSPMSTGLMYFWMPPYIQGLVYKEPVLLEIAQ